MNEQQDDIKLDDVNGEIVSDYTYDVNPEDEKIDIVSNLEDFFNSYVVDTVQESFRVFQTFTYGEMVIAFLLLCILLVIVLKWYFEVIR